jgi:acyl carrier protein
MKAVHMTEAQLRELIISALEQAHALGLNNESEKQAFIRGDTDIDFEKLEMDSLAIMHFCIAVETHTGVPIIPRTLKRMRSLYDLVAELSAASSRPKVRGLP